METKIYMVFENTAVEFKSYYVVWKPKMSCNDIFGFIVFKSYYVVWKHKMFNFSKKNNVGLNRTMQYGNKHKVKKENTQKGFKSYYVVWKPKKSNIITTS